VPPWRSICRSAKVHRDWCERFLPANSGDSGSGAPLGSFEEMTAGVGPALSYAAQIGG